MANTRQSAKRARQELKRQARNRTIRSAGGTALRKALVLFAAAKQAKPDLEKATEVYRQAVKAIAKAAARGAIAHGRAKRKISRLTKLAMVTLPDALPFGKGKTAGAPKATKKKSGAAPKPAAT